jgi:hypothetical protein
MRKRSNILLAILFVAVLGGIAWRMLRDREPVYQGKSLTSWLEQFQADDPPQSEAEHLRAQTEAREAIRHCGTNALPTLLRMTRARDSALEIKVLALAGKQSLISFHPRLAHEYHRMSWGGFEVLGSEARPAVPALIRLLNDADDDIRVNAAYDLGYIGPAAGEAAPVLYSKYFTDTSEEMKFYAFKSLASIHANPKQCVPLFIEVLGKHQESSSTCAFAIMGLGNFGANAKSAFPLLVPFLTNEVEFVRSDATNALKQIDPEAAAKIFAGSQQR